MSVVYTVRFSDKSKRRVTGRSALQALLSARAESHGAFFYSGTLQHIRCAIDGCRLREYPRKFGFILYIEPHMLPVEHESRNTCHQCLRWWCPTHAFDAVSFLGNTVCSDCYRDGLLSGSIVDCCTSCDLSGTTKECQECHDQFCTNCIVYYSLQNCGLHGGLTPVIAKRIPRITMLVVIMANKRKRVRRLPAEVWQLIYDEFI